MNAIEKDIMKGLVSILNEASDRYYNSGNPIMTDAQFDARLSDLKAVRNSRSGDLRLLRRLRAYRA